MAWGAKVRFHNVPLIDGVKELLALDEAPGGTYSNRDHLNSENAVIWYEGLSEENQLVLCDAQTAGGLLLSVSADHAGAMKTALIAANTLCAVEIGEIVEDSECRIYTEL